MQENNNKDRASHILGTSSTLLGFSFLVLVDLHAVGLARNGVIAKMSAICVGIFAISTFLSYASIHAKTKGKGYRLEAFASHIFLIGLSLLIIAALLLSFNVMQ